MNTGKNVRADLGAVPELYSASFRKADLIKKNNGVFDNIDISLLNGFLYFIVNLNKDNAL